jgi:signal transduction histidine kinase
MMVLVMIPARAGLTLFAVLTARALREVKITTWINIRRGRRCYDLDGKAPLNAHDRMAGSNDINQDHGPQADPAGRFPWGWVGSAFVLTVLMFVGLAWHVRSTFDVGREVAESFVASDQLRDLMTELQQQLATTAIFLIATHDPSWKTRHLEVEARLQEALEETIQHSETGYNREALIQAGDAIRELSRIEAEATTLADWGEVNEALSLLSGEEYRGWQQRFLGASQLFIDDHRRFLNSRLAIQAEREVQSVGVAFIILLLSLTIWMALVRRLQRWGSALDQESRIRRQLEAGLLQAQKMEAVGRLASGIAHDFRNLLTAIRGYVTLAREQIHDDHPAGHALGRVEEAADQAEGVIRGLLTFGRRSVAEKKAVDLGELVTRGGRWVQRMVPASVRLETRIADDTGGLWVLADPVQLQQVLLNLAVNACDAMPGGGGLAIAVDREEQATPPRVTMTVSDNGCGMSPEVAERAMEPFFTTKLAGEGTGLGLAMAHGIVAQHDGRMSIESEPGQGTTVTICLPAIPAPTEPTEPTRDTDTFETGEGRVLLAEPHPYARQIMGSALEAVGFEVLAVADGSALKEVLSESGQGPVLTVLDARLPGVETENRLFCLRELGYRGPVLLVGLASDADPAGLPDDAVILLRKPVRVGELKRLALGMTRAKSDRRRIE